VIISADLVTSLEGQPFVATIGTTWNGRALEPGEYVLVLRDGRLEPEPVTGDG
jgi:hypothetical protein